MKLDIGCGLTWDKDFEGLDISDFGQKYVRDIARDGLKGIEDNTVDEIRCWSTLEHIPMDRELFVMNEMWRVLKLGGKLHIKVPRFPHENAVIDPTHKSFYVTKKFTQYYAGKRPRNAKYYDHTGREMRKWGICNDGKGNYILNETDREIDIWLYKR